MESLRRVVSVKYAPDSEDVIRPEPLVALTARIDDLHSELILTVHRVAGIHVAARRAVHGRVSRIRNVKNADLN